MAFFEVNKKTFLKFPFRKKGTVFFGLLLIGLAAVCFPPVSLMAMGLVATIAASVGFVVLGTLFILSLLKWMLKPSFQNLNSDALQLPPTFDHRLIRNFLSGGKKAALEGFSEEEKMEDDKRVDDPNQLIESLNEIIKSFTYFVTVSRDLDFFLLGAMKRMEREEATAETICDEILLAKDMSNEDDRFEELCFICRIAACRVPEVKKPVSASTNKVSEEFFRWWGSMWQEESTSYEESSNGKKYESDEIFKSNLYTYVLFKTDDPYEVLGLDKNATGEQINKAFRAAMIKNHPDKGGIEGRAKEVTEAREEILKPFRQFNHDGRSHAGERGARGDEQQIFSSSDSTNGRPAHYSLTLGWLAGHPGARSEEAEVNGRGEEMRMFG